MNVGSIVYGAAVNWWLLQVTGIRMLWKPCARRVSNKALVTRGLPQDVSSGMASRVLPKFQPGCIAATASIALSGTWDTADWVSPNAVPLATPPAVISASAMLATSRSTCRVLAMSQLFSVD